MINSSHNTSRFLSRVNFSRDPHARFFYDQETDPNNPNPPAPPAANPPAGKPVEKIVEETISRLLGKTDNDPQQAMSILIRENNALTQRAETAERNQLSKADRDLLAKFKALNIPIDDVNRIVGEHKSMSEEKAKNAKRESLKKAAEKAGFNPDLLASLEGALDVEYSVIGEGETAKAMVKVKNGGTVSDKALDEWVKEKWPALQETLKAAPQNNQQQSQQQNNGQRTVTRYGQSAGVGAASGGAGNQTRDRIQERLDARAEANKEKKNPLMA